MDDPAEKAGLLNRRVGHFQPEGGSARAAAYTAPYGRLLSGIRGLRLEVTDVRATSEFAGKRPAQIRTASRPG